jgi:hypothetical protein
VFTCAYRFEPDSTRGRSTAGKARWAAVHERERDGTRLPSVHTVSSSLKYATVIEIVAYGEEKVAIPLEIL